MLNLLRKLFNWSTSSNLNSDISEPVISLLKAMSEPRRFRMKMSQKDIASSIQSRSFHHAQNFKYVPLKDTKTGVDFYLSISNLALPLGTYPRFTLEMTEDTVVSFGYYGQPFTEKELQRLNARAYQIVYNYLQRHQRVVYYLKNKRNRLQERVFEKEKKRQYDKSRQQLMEAYVTGGINESKEIS
jgi:hypothetical protein